MSNVQRVQSQELRCPHHTVSLKTPLDERLWFKLKQIFDILGDALDHGLMGFDEFNEKTGTTINVR